MNFRFKMFLRVAPPDANLLLDSQSPALEYVSTFRRRILRAKYANGRLSDKSHIDKTI